MFDRTHYCCSSRASHTLLSMLYYQAGTPVIGTTQSPERSCMILHIMLHTISVNYLLVQSILAVLDRLLSYFHEIFYVPFRGTLTPAQVCIHKGPVRIENLHPSAKRCSSKNTYSGMSMSDQRLFNSYHSFPVVHSQLLQIHFMEPSTPVLRPLRR